MRVLSDTDVATVLSLADLLPAVEEAFVKQGRGDVERPPRPHFPISEGETAGKFREFVRETADMQGIVHRNRVARSGR